MQPERACWGLLAALAWGTASAQAERIVSASFFTGRPHTLIDFETDGSGQAVAPGPGSPKDMPAGAYATLGILFNPAIQWVNDGDADFDAAQSIGGSLDVAMPGAPHDDFVITFLAPTRALGFWVVNNRFSAAVPALEARDAAGGTIETVYFTGDAIDGRIGIAEYGFLGIASDVDIASVRITKDATLLDDFRFSPVPEPGTMALVAVVGLIAVSSGGSPIRKHACQRPGAKGYSTKTGASIGGSLNPAGCLAARSKTGPANLLTGPIRSILLPRCKRTSPITTISTAARR